METKFQCEVRGQACTCVKLEGGDGFKELTTTMNNASVLVQGSYLVIVMCRGEESVGLLDTGNTNSLVVHLTYLIFSTDND